MKKLLTILFLLAFGFLSAFAQVNPSANSPASPRPALVRPVRNVIAAHRRKHRRHRRHHRRRVRRLRRARLARQQVPPQPAK
jgi:hypothetical protein